MPASEVATWNPSRLLQRSEMAIQSARKGRSELIKALLFTGRLALARAACYPSPSTM
jgi:hypothetical protein